jgi:hypothetical protein
MYAVRTKDISSFLFALAGLCFFYSPSAKAQTFQPSTSVQHLHRNLGDFSISRLELPGANRDSNLWIPWFEIPAGAQFNRIEFRHTFISKIFILIAAREFLIRTGLSPPC